EERPVLLTKEGLRQLQEELDQLVQVRRGEGAERNPQSRDFGDNAEKAADAQAKKEQNQPEGRSQTPEARMRHALGVEDGPREKGVVGVGAKVTLSTDEGQETYDIVGAAEADPRRGRISNESPLGRALLGHRAGDEADWTSPSGTSRVRVLSVSWHPLRMTAGGAGALQRRHRALGRYVPDREPIALPATLRDRREKLERLVAEGVDPYAAHFHRTHTTAEALKLLDGAPDGRAGPVTVAGRLMVKRGQGGMTFAELQDGSGRIQLVAQRDVLGEAPHDRFLRLDPGDLIGATGRVAPTRRGEPSIWIETFCLLSKSLRPLPEKWHGLRDVEMRYRQRYLDLIANPEVRVVFAA